jgi:drug/metabolite transporter (DMT)-like permease
MSWQLLIILNVFTFSISTLLQRVILQDKKSKPIAYAIFFQLFTGIITVFVGLFFGLLQFPILFPLSIYLLLAICLYAFSNLYIFKALKKTEASKFTIIFTTRGLFNILASTLFLNESLTPLQICGAILIFVGVVLVSLKSTKLSFGSGDLFALMAAIFFGFANTNARFLLKHFTVFPYMSLIFIAPALLLSLIYPQELKNISFFLRPKIIMKVFLLCIFYFIANVTFFTALKIGSNSSQVTTAALTNVIVTVILSIIFLKERTNMWRKIIGATISFVGLVVISM